MDSEHRHELKSNALVNILTHFPEYCKENAYFIIGLALIITAIVTWPIFSKMKDQKVMAQQSYVSDAIQQLNQGIGKALMFGLKDLDVFLDFKVFRDVEYFPV